MKTLWVLLMGVAAFTASAQSKCEESFSAFEAKYNLRAYEDAYKLMPELRKKCPKFSDRLYVYGEKVLKYKIEISRTPEDKQKNIDELITFYTEQDINYPGTGGAVKKIMLQHDHKLIKDEEAYAALDAAFNKNRQAFTDYTALQTYFLLLRDRYTANKGITDQEFITKYSDISGQVAFAKNKIGGEREAILKKQETQMITDEERQFLKDAEPTLKGFDAVSDNISILASKEFSCEKMEVFYEKGFDGNKTNAGWLSGMVTVMFDNKCYGSNVLYNGTKALYDLKPTAETAYQLGVLTLKKGNTKEGMGYFDKAASMEAVPAKKAALYYEMATIFRNQDKAEAKKYALKTLEIDPKSGKAYLLLAGMYANAGKECEMTDFERKALNWLAEDTARKAEAVEPKYKPTVAKLVEGYNKNKPTKDLAKAVGKKKGDTITFGCWINEAITIPNL